MSRPAALLLAFVFCLPAAPARAAGEVVAGVIISLVGAPTVKAAKGKASKALKRNQFVNDGDQIATKAGEYVSIAFIGGAEVRISESSTFDVESGGGKKPTQLFTTIGKAWTRMLHGHSGISIRTPTAVAAVRGTEADIESNERMTVKVYEGFVDVSNAQGKQSLVAGQMTQVAGAGSAPEAPKTMSDSDRGTWQNGLKTDGTEEAVERLQKEADRRRSLEVKTKDGKTLKLNLEKK